MILIKTLLVEDNPDAVITFKQICHDFFPQIKIIAEFNNAKDALTYFKKNKIDWLVLDIELEGEINGFDLLNLIGLKRNFEVIFYSGRDNQYIDAIRVHAFDFLHKPFLITELKNTVNRYLATRRELHSKSKPKDKETNDTESEELFKVNTHEKTVFIKPDDIVYMMANGSYTEVYYVKQQMVEASRNLSFLVEAAKNPNLYRIGRSIVVNKTQIESVLKISAKKSLLKFKDGSERELSNILRRKMNYRINLN
jgi:two-component system, LytTR family, response regulator